jgi:hypothetical protein
MNDLAIETTVCHGCYALLDAADNYCRHCGIATANLAGLSEGRIAAASFSGKPVLTPSDQQPRWSESPWVVLPLLFLILGPLALPLLWRSRQFTLLWRSVLTVIMVGLTVFLLWSVWFSLQQALTPLRELDKLRRF